MNVFLVYIPFVFIIFIVINYLYNGFKFIVIELPTIFTSSKLMFEYAYYKDPKTLKLQNFKWKTMKG